MNREELKQIVKELLLQTLQIQSSKKSQIQTSINFQRQQVKDWDQKNIKCASICQSCGSKLIKKQFQQTKIQFDKDLNSFVHEQQLLQSQIGNKIKKERIQNFKNYKKQKKIKKTKTKKDKTRAIFLGKIKKYFDLYHNKEQNQKIKIKPLKDFATQNNMSYSSICLWYKKWRDDPSLAAQQQKKVTCRSISNITINRKKRILQILQQKPYYNAEQIKNELQKFQDCKKIDKSQNVQKDININCIYKILKDANYSFKRIQQIPVKRNQSSNIQGRAQYCQIMETIFKDANSVVYFLDQTTLNLHLKRQKAWGKKGVDLVMVVPESKGKTLSVLALMSEEGIIKHQLTTGMFNKQAFIQVFARWLDELNSNSNTQQNIKRYIVLDNSPIHGRQQTLNLAKSKKLQCLFLPPYTPQLNAIQNFFNQLKIKIRKEQFKNQKELHLSANKVLKSYRNADFKNYYRNVKKFIEMGKNKIKF